VHRDNERPQSAAQHLRDIGNSVIVVEHDKDMILHRPRFGLVPARMVTAGIVFEQVSTPAPLTSQYLSGRHIEMQRKTLRAKAPSWCKKTPGNLKT
jgi:excinuclease ABC subunit A